MLSSTPLSYFFQHHQRHSLQYATHASRPTTLPTLVHHPRHPCWHIIYASMSLTLACYLRNSSQYVTHATHPAHTIHAGTLTTLTCHRRQHCQHATRDNTPLTQANHPRHSGQDVNQANTPPTLARLPRMERHFSTSHGIKHIKLQNFCRIRENANYIIVDKSDKNYTATSKKIKEDTKRIMSRSNKQ